MPSGSFTTPYIPSVTCLDGVVGKREDAGFRSGGIFQQVRLDQVPPLATAAIMRAS